MIEDYHFGSITINQKEYNNDVLVTKDKVLDWWRIEGHRVVEDDLEEALEEKPEFIIIGTGATGLIKISRELREFIELKDIGLIDKKTDEAVKDYNKLEKEDKKVVGLFHLTC